MYGAVALRIRGGRSEETPSALKAPRKQRERRAWVDSQTRPIFSKRCEQIVLGMHAVAITLFIIGSIGCAVLGTWIGSALDDQGIGGRSNASSRINGSDPLAPVLYPDGLGNYWQTCLTVPEMSSGVLYNDILSTVGEDFVIVGGLGLCLITLALRWRWMFLAVSVVSGVVLIKVSCQIVLHWRYLASHALFHLTGAVGAQCDGAEALVGGLIFFCAVMIVAVALYCVVSTVGCMAMAQQSRLRYRPLNFASVALACVGFAVSVVAIADAEEEGREIHAASPRDAPPGLTPLFFWTATDLDGTPSSSRLVDKYFILFACEILGALLDGQLDVATQVLASELVSASIISTALCCVSLWPGVIYYQRRYAVDGVFRDCRRWGAGSPADAVARAEAQIAAFGEDNMLRYDQLSRRLCTDHRAFFAGELLLLVASHVLLVVRAREFIRIRYAKLLRRRRERSSGGGSDEHPPAATASCTSNVFAVLIGTRSAACNRGSASSAVDDVDFTACNCDAVSAVCRACCAVGARVTLVACTCCGRFVGGDAHRRALEGWGGNGVNSRVHIGAGSSTPPLAPLLGGVDDRGVPSPFQTDATLFDDSFDVTLLSEEDKRRFRGEEDVGGGAGGGAIGETCGETRHAPVRVVGDEVGVDALRDASGKGDCEAGGGRSEGREVDDRAPRASAAVEAMMTPEQKGVCEWLRAHAFEQYIESVTAPARIASERASRRGDTFTGLGVTSLAGLTLLSERDLAGVGMPHDEVADFIAIADGLKLSVLL